MNKHMATVAGIIAAQCIFLLGMTYQQERRLTTGDNVLLETQPVDPRDLLRGDYVILSYKISDVPIALFREGGNSLGEGNTVYVRLAKTTEFHTIVEAGHDPLEPRRGTVVMRGILNRGWSEGQTNVRVQYGLEKFFVPEGTGNPSGKVTVEASVGKNGQAMIREVFIDGRPYNAAMRK